MKCICGHGESCKFCNPYFDKNKDVYWLQKEVARLREELERAREAATFVTNGMRIELEAAEARVAELEQAHLESQDPGAREAIARRAAESAMTSARAALTSAHHPPPGRDEVE